MNLSIDFCGPIPTGETLLVITDEYSRYPVVEILRNTTVDSLIPIVDKTFALFGIPSIVKSDNGPQFKSNKWKMFMDSYGIKHRCIMPLWPKANAQAESFNKPMMKAIRSAHIQHRNWKQALYQFCRTYRATPHCTTQFSPHFLMFSREPRTKLPEHLTNTHPKDADVRSRDSAAKLKMKATADKRHHAKPNTIQCGDAVLVKQHKDNKLSTNYNPTPLLVTNTKGSMVTAQKPDGSSVTRNASLFRRMPASVTPAPPEIPEVIPIFTETGLATPTESLPSPPSQSPSQPQLDECNPPPRRSGRQTKIPERFKDFVRY